MKKRRRNKGKERERKKKKKKEKDKDKRQRGGQKPDLLCDLKAVLGIGNRICF